MTAIYYGKDTDPDTKAISDTVTERTVSTTFMLTVDTGTAGMRALPRTNRLGTARKLGAKAKLSKGITTGTALAKDTLRYNSPRDLQT